MNYRIYILIILGISIFSCRDDDGGPIVQNADVSLKIAGKYQGETFLTSDCDGSSSQVYDYNGKSLMFCDFNFYLSNHALFVSNSSDDVVLDEIEHVDLGIFDGKAAADSGYKLIIGRAPINQTYSGLSFSLGVPADLNRTKPSEYGGNHPLSKEEQYNSNSNSYLFLELTGKVDHESDGTFDDDFNFNLLFDEAFRDIEISMELEVLEDQENAIEIELDIFTLLNNGLQTINFDEQLETSSTQYDEIMRTLKNNFSAALKVK